MNIHPIPAFTDNYLWLIQHHNGDAVVVDPGDGKAVITALEKLNLQLSGILVTHHHNDHIGGIPDLLNYKSVPVYGPTTDRIPTISHPLKEGDNITLFEGDLSFKIVEVPGHTYDHIAYIGELDNNPIVFCGDTLFAAGCGRKFDGTFDQFYQSLDKLNSLPSSTLVYCTHEYTLANLNFAIAVEPTNNHIGQRLKDEKLKRDQGLPTLPSTLELERQTNPFLRYRLPSVAQTINRHWDSSWSSDLDLFTGLRKWKDDF